MPPRAPAVTAADAVDEAFGSTTELGLVPSFNGFPADHRAVSPVSMNCPPRGCDCG